MAWKADLSDVPQPIPSYKLLRLAVYKLYRKGIVTNPLEVLKDDMGIWGYRYPQFILVAKKELYGNIVSVHEQAVFKARLLRIRIVMWINDAKKFYSFNPDEIEKTAKKNYKGRVLMYNFSIKLGSPLDNW